MEIWFVALPNTSWARSILKGDRCTSAFGSNLTSGNASEKPESTVRQNKRKVGVGSGDRGKDGGEATRSVVSGDTTGVKMSAHAATHLLRTAS